MDEQEQAEQLIVQMIQEESFPTEVEACKDSKVISASSKLARLKPIWQEGLMRVGGRLQECTENVVKHPIILPQETSAVRLLVRWFHEKLGHCGQNYLVAELRKEYWILKVNSLARSVIRKCVVCRAIAAKPITQEMAPLPADRVNAGEPPFTNAATDCFGPFFVKVGRSQVKRYGVLFTCLSSRAIHIEVADSMETDSFLNALRRFLARRGSVKVMRADNGTNFVGADNVLRKELEKLNHSVIGDALATRGITWCYNPPYASHWGGAWERQIRTIRRVLKGICHQQTLTDDSLATLFCEVEAIVNGRPLVRATDDPSCLETLSPSMLLNLKGSPAPFTSTVGTDQYSRARWKQVQYLADVFWKRWTREYLPLLQQRQRWTTLRRNLEVDDIVLVLDEKLPRGSWPLARVVEVIRGSDGNVRSARVQSSSGVYLRPVSKMCLLLECEQ